MADTKEIIVNIDDLDLEPHTKEWLTRVFDHAYKKGAESVLSKYPSPNALIILVEDLIQKHNTMYAADALGKLFECDFRDSAIVAKQWLKGFKGEK